MSRLTALVSFYLLTAWSAWAQAPAPSPAPGGTTETAPGTPAATGGGIMDYWWVILLVIIAIAAIWYFSRGRSRV